MSKPLEELEESVVNGVTIAVHTLLEQLGNKTFKEVQWNRVHFGQNVSHCLFTKCVFNDTRFPDILKTTFSECVFQNCTFANITMKSVTFAKCTMDNCVMEDAQIQECTLDNSHIKWSMCHCKLRSITVRDVTIAGEINHTTIMDQSVFQRVTWLDNSLVRHSTFNGTQFKSIKSKKGAWVETMFGDCVFSMCNFSHAVSFEGCKWTHTAIRHSCLLDCWMVRCEMVHCILDTTKWMRCCLKHAKMAHVDLRGGTFAYNNMENATLQNVKFKLCDTKSNNKKNAWFRNVEYEGEATKVITATFEKSFKYRMNYKYELVGFMANGKPIEWMGKMEAICATETQEELIFAVSSEVLLHAALLKINKISTSTFSMLVPFSTPLLDNVITHIKFDGKTCIVGEVDLKGVRMRGFLPSMCNIRKRAYSL